MNYGEYDIAETLPPGGHAPYRGGGGDAFGGIFLGLAGPFLVALVFLVGQAIWQAVV